MILLRLAILPLFPVPLPFVPDDFSFLLACDTFAHGRLTNPTPAMWTHFESIHITMQPTYQSMYFPGQGLVLAASKVLFGNPWIGLLIVSALMCAALCWMLQAWLPANWALLGGLIAVLRLGVFSYWTNTYHAGGSLGALGGALILGGAAAADEDRAYSLCGADRHRHCDSGADAAIRGHSALPAGCGGAGPLDVEGEEPAERGCDSRAWPRRRWRLVWPPCAWMGYYDYRAFGSPLTPPYTVDRNTYAIAPYYVWQQRAARAGLPLCGDAELLSQGRGEISLTKIHSLSGFLPHTLEKVAFTFLFYAGFALLIPLIMVRRVFLDRRIRFLVVCVLVLAAGMVIEIYLLPHYVAPFTAAFYAIGLQAMRHLRLWKPEGKPVGLAMVRFDRDSVRAAGGLAAFCAAASYRAAANGRRATGISHGLGPEHFGVERAQIEALARTAAWQATGDRPLLRKPRSIRRMGL